MKENNKFVNPFEFLKTRWEPSREALDKHGESSLVLEVVVKSGGSSFN